MPGFPELGEYRFPLPPTASTEERLEHNERMLARSLNTPAMVAFVGAGISAHRGYPTWPEFVRGLLETTRAALQREQHPLTESIAALADLADGAVGERALFIVGRCRTALEAAGLIETDYAKFIRESFGPERAVGSAPDLVKQLLDLEITRFATTNYDMEIERALLRGSPLPEPAEISPEQLGTEGIRRLHQVCSFHQLREHHPAQALFPLSRVGWTKNMVFHLHGRYDEVGSIVATEEDYQRFYLDQTGDRLFFHKTIDLLLRSNPILFVGYRLEDEDLNRYLRTLAVAAPALKSSRPLFALLPFGEDAEVQPLLDRFFDRHGVHVVPYRSAGSDPAAWAHSLSAKLTEIQQLKTSWRDGWLAKPAIRKITLHKRPPDLFHHHQLTHRIPRPLGEARMSRALENLEDACRDHSLIVLLGRGGMGKSFTVQKFLQEQDRRGFAGAFFWSSYYTDDAITGLDRALGYMDPDGRHTGGRFRRLEKCLREKRYLLVFDGFERLLAEQEGGAAETGSPTTYGVRHFLEIISSEKNQGVVVLTTRLWPTPVGQIGQLPGHIQLLRLEDMQPTDLERHAPFSAYKEAELAELCSLLRGHAYGLLLSGRYLELRGDHDSALRDLSTRLSRRHEMARNSDLVNLLLTELETEKGAAVRKLLERIVLFVSPVSRAIVDSLYDTCDLDEGAISSADALECLLDNHLVFQIEQTSLQGPRSMFTTHPTVRAFVVRRNHGGSAGAMPNFTLPGFTSGTAVIDPGPPEARKTLESVVEVLDRRSRAAHDADDASRAIDHCRALFGALRSSTETLTAPRWGTYLDQMRMAFTAINLARYVAPSTWRFHTSLAAVSDPSAPLYPDELAWLYNDAGLACCAEGQMADTFAIWDQGYQINRVVEPEVGQYIVQSLLHLGHTYIEIGRLDIARGYLKDCELNNAKIDSEDYTARIAGYLGVLAHLQGNTQKALRLYDEALASLQGNNPNPRAESWFLFHRANLKSAQGEFTDAKNDLDTAYGIAESHRYRDLVGHARGGYGRLARGRNDLSLAQEEYDAALRIAREIGMRRLEAEALSELARIALERKDHVTGFRQGISSLALANELGLGLRQTHALVIIAMASAGLGFREFAMTYVDHALALAKFQGYGSREREIQHIRAQIDSRRSDPR